MGAYFEELKERRFFKINKCGTLARNDEERTRLVSVNGDLQRTRQPTTARSPLHYVHCGSMAAEPSQSHLIVARRELQEPPQLANMGRRTAVSRSTPDHNATICLTDLGHQFPGPTPLREIRHTALPRPPAIECGERIRALTCAE